MPAPRNNRYSMVTGESPNLNFSKFENEGWTIIGIASLGTTSTWCFSVPRFARSGQSGWPRISASNSPTVHVRTILRPPRGGGGHRAGNESSEGPESSRESLGEVVADVRHDEIKRSRRRDSHAVVFLLADFPGIR